jgi:hypothetical protein
MAPIGVARRDPLSQSAQLSDDMTPRHPLPAWLLSLSLHLALLLTLGLTLRTLPRGGAAEPDRAGGIVLVRQTDQRREYFDAQSTGAQFPAQQHAQIARQSALPDAGELPVDFSGILPRAEQVVGQGVASGLPGASDLTSGPGVSRQIGGSVQTSVFGTTGIGSKFVYVFDRSGSMSGHGGRPLLAAKSQLIASLRDLDRIHQFQIIFYNERPRIFNPTGGTPRLVWGDESSKELAHRFVQGIAANGGTRHLQALKLALGMSPDVVFFLTDADEPHLTPDELLLIRRWNRATMINAIEFGYGPSIGDNNFLVRLARENGGQHAYVDISQLGRP